MSNGSPVEDIIMRGMLIKRSVSASSPRRNWQPRCLLLLSTEIRWYADVDAKKLRGQLPITESTQLVQDADPSNGKPWTFGIKTGARELMLQASGPEERRQWLWALQGLTMCKSTPAVGYSPAVGSEIKEAARIAPRSQRRIAATTLETIPSVSSDLHALRWTQADDAAATTEGSVKLEATVVESVKEGETIEAKVEAGVEATETEKMEHTYDAHAMAMSLVGAAIATTLTALEAEEAARAEAARDSLVSEVVQAVLEQVVLRAGVRRWVSEMVETAIDRDAAERAEEGRAQRAAILAAGRSAKLQPSHASPQHLQLRRCRGGSRTALQHAPPTPPAKSAAAAKCVRFSQEAPECQEAPSPTPASPRRAVLSRRVGRGFFRAITSRRSDHNRRGVAISGCL